MAIAKLSFEKLNNGMLLNYEILLKGKIYSFHVIKWCFFPNTLLHIADGLFTVCSLLNNFSPEFEQVKDTNAYSDLTVRNMMSAYL